VSGRAAAAFLLSQGKNVVATDKNTELFSTHPEILRLKELGLRCEQEIEWESIDLVVVSPGVSPEHELYREARKRGIEVVGEAELALRHFKQPLLAVTGTNGKTTVTLLLEHILKAAGLKAKALGNVGDPLCSYLLHSDPEEVIVVELSSYQLETMESRVFDAGVILNITPDHLDRYSSMEEYARAKCRLQLSLKEGAPLWVHSSVKKEFGHMLHWNPLSTFDREKIEPLLPFRYREMGKHETENAQAAWALLKGMAIPELLFTKALDTFKKPSHRIEWIGCWGDVSFYDDSKGTNIDAVVRAVDAMKGKVILIAGGVDKGASYLLWKEPFQNKVKEIITIGEAASKIENELKPFYKVRRAETLQCAVRMAAESAKKGDSVLLSPGCSSFDMFRDYKHRGEEFQRCVHQLQEE
jgi:UDP-N-acetylmuramoylalanine--D-glutamate ligase